MDPAQIALLISLGLTAGFVAGLVGLGGGIIFAPVLLFYFHHAAGVAPNLVPALTIGTSLFCTLVAALSSAWHQHRAGALHASIAWQVGLGSVVAVSVVTRFVTTQPWFDVSAFQTVFGGLLLVVALRMLRPQSQRQFPATSPGGAERVRWPLLAGTGLGAGAVASAAGVGGGIVLVPAYRRLLHLPMAQAVGTSSGTIVLISCAGVASYALGGWGGSGLPATALGYVDVAPAVLLAGPSVLGARAGVWATHRLPTRVLRWCFAGAALFVAGRMLYGTLVA